MTKQGTLHRRDFLRITAQTGAVIAASSLPAADPITFPDTNLIVAENRRPGTTDWLLRKLEPAHGRKCPPRA